MFGPACDPQASGLAVLYCCLYRTVLLYCCSHSVTLSTKSTYLQDADTWEEK